MEPNSGKYSYTECRSDSNDPSLLKCIETTTIRNSDGSETKESKEFTTEANSQSYYGYNSFGFPGFGIPKWAMDMMHSSSSEVYGFLKENYPHVKTIGGALSEIGGNTKAFSKKISSPITYIDYLLKSPQQQQQTQEPLQEKPYNDTDIYDI